MSTTRWAQCMNNLHNNILEENMREIRITNNAQWKSKSKEKQIGWKKKRKHKQMWNDEGISMCFE